MNREIEKYYIDRIDENQSEDLTKDALVAGIRSGNVELIRKAAEALPSCGEFYGYSSPLEFAIKEMASAEVIKTLINAGYELSKPCHDLTPLNGSPRELVELWMETKGITKEEALQLLATDIGYFFHVIRTNYSCCRISYDIDSEDRYKPCFWNYFDEWMAEFLKLLVDENGSGIMSSYFGRGIIENAEFKKACDTLIELFGQIFSNDDFIWYINIAVSRDNEHAFEKLIEYRPSLMKEVTCYPSSSKKILSAILEAGLLAPGSEEGVNAFIPRIAFGEIDKDILTAIAHPSYSAQTSDEGKTPLMYAIENDDFPVELYKLLVTSPEDLNIQDEDGQTALHYMAKTEYPECIENLLELGADLFITDNKGNNVLHVLADNREMLSIDNLGDCISLLPKKLLTMENSKGRTPVTLFFQRLTGTEEEPYKRIPFSQFLEECLASPESLSGNILIGGADNEARLKTLSLVRNQVIRQLDNSGIEFELIAGRTPGETVSLLEKLADERNGIFHLVVIDELYYCQNLELRMRFEYAINSLDGNADVLVIAASKLSSADIITDIIQHAFPYRITSKQSSELTSEIFIGEDYAAYIGMDEVIIKGFGDDLLLCNLESDENEREGNDSRSSGEIGDDSIVLAEAERILSALDNIWQTFDGVELYPTLEEKAARLACSLVSNHSFRNGNKRIGILAMLTFLSFNGIEIECTDTEIVETGLRLASGLMDYEPLHFWLSEHCAVRNPCRNG